MKTVTKLNAAILKITTVMQSECPELIKYLNEMPETIPAVSNPQIDLTILKEYYNSLESLLFKYELNHATKNDTIKKKSLWNQSTK